MTLRQLLRRTAVLAVATLLATSIGMRPLYAIDADPANSDKKADHKKTVKKETKSKKSAGEQPRIAQPPENAMTNY